MSRSSGAGSPIWFRCARCRKGGGPGGFVQRVKPTGKAKPSPRPGVRGARSAKQSYQYECLDCGHVGWSNHKDLECKIEQSGK